MALLTVLRFICILQLVLIDKCSSLNCLSGSNLPLPSLFKTIEDCTGDQVCYIHKSETGLFSAGCQQQATCPSSAVSLVGRREVRSSAQCTECCDTDYCNNQGCGAFVVSKPSRGSMCYDCNFITEPSHCKDVTMCKAGHVCIVQTSSEFTGYYHQACVPETACPTTYNVAYCTAANASCCGGDFCNRVCLPGTPPTPGPALTDQERLELECQNHNYVFDSLLNLCVKVFMEPQMTFTRQQAEERCHHDNAELVSITNIDEQDFLVYWIFTHQLNGTDYWISAKTNDDGSRDFYWVDSSPVQYNHWGGDMTGQPDDARRKDEDCVFLNHKDQYYWHDDHCDARKSGYICEIWNVTGDDKVRMCRHLVLSGYDYDTTSDLCIKIRQGQIGMDFTYQEAVDDCANDGADLVTIDNYSKTNLILNWIFAKHANATDFWIGATDKDNTSVFYWPDGQRMSYTHWGNAVLPEETRSQPDEQYGVRDENCVYLDYHHEYHWFDENCTANKTGYICEVFANDTASLVQTCRHRLYEGYFYDVNSNMCVKMNTVTDGIGRETARNACKADDADLTIVDTNSKTDFLLEWIFYQRLNGSDFWIGGKDLSADGRFYWQHTEVPFSYTHWYNATRAEGCVYMDSQNTYHWRASGCEEQTRGYICQINQFSIANTISGTQ